jgi:glycosyltransferase involved in cell wall biosynthesis
MIAAYLKLFEQMDVMVQARHYVRPRNSMSAPPVSVGGVSILPGDFRDDLNYVNGLLFWPNAPVPNGLASGSVRTKTSHKAPSALTDYKVLVAIPYGQIGGVDVFSSHLVRRLMAKGIEAKIVGARQFNDSVMSLPISGDVPVEAPDMPEDATWPMRWQAMIGYIEAQAPCIYLPNYAYDYSCIAPRLSQRVKVVSIAHSDDPAHYDHVARLGRASDAIVGVSAAITRHVAGLDPSLIPRLYMIPYGVELPTNPPMAKPPDPNGRLRILFAGRIICHQKRALDLVRIAELLDERNVPFELIVAGDGHDADRFRTLGTSLTLKRAIWMPGKLTNEQVTELMRECDVFILPSAFEGLSVGLLEAMANGLIPVVSNMRSGVPELIRHGENGLIVPIGDINGFAEQLTYLQRCPDERCNMSRAAYETIRNNGYQLEDMIDRYLDLFNTVISQDFVRAKGPIAAPIHLKHEQRGSFWHGTTSGIRRSP